LLFAYIYQQQQRKKLVNLLDTIPNQQELVFEKINLVLNNTIKLEHSQFQIISIKKNKGTPDLTIIFKDGTNVGVEVKILFLFNFGLKSSLLNLQIVIYIYYRKFGF